MRKGFFIVLLMAFFIGESEGFDHYFYKGNPGYGSEGQFNPGSVYVNGSLDILRNGWAPRKIQDIEFANSFKLLNKSLSNYSETIERYNSRREADFFRDQFLPKEWTSKKGAWFPNYQSHMIGEGMLSRKLAEWYDVHDYPFAYGLGVITTFAFQYTNEIMELAPFENTSIDPIADIYYFNTAGYLLFSIDPVARFFSETVKLNSWNPQPVISPIDGLISNAGEQYILKTNISSTGRFQGFYSWGIDGSAGFTYNGEKGRNYSLGFGQKAFRLKQSLVNDMIVYPELEPHFVFFYDRNESLMLSFSQTGIEKANLVLNIYPGLINDKLGLYVSYNDFSKLEAGITCLHIPMGLQY